MGSDVNGCRDCSLESFFGVKNLGGEKWDEFFIQSESIIVLAKNSVCLCGKDVDFYYELRVLPWKLLSW